MRALRPIADDLQYDFRKLILDRGKRLQQQFVPFTGMRFPTLRITGSSGSLSERRKHFRVNPVIDDRGVHPRAGALDHLVANFFADANHRACRAIHRSRYPGTPLPGPAFNLSAGKRIETMHRHHEGYFQLPAEQQGGVAAGQSGMGMDHVHGMRSMQAPDLSQQSGETEKRPKLTVPIRPEEKKSAPTVPAPQTSPAAAPPR